jgi:hypothetical protein
MTVLVLVLLEYTCVNSCTEWYICILHFGILILFWGWILSRMKWVIGLQDWERRHTLVTLVRLSTAWSQTQSTIRSTSCILYSLRWNHLPVHKTLLNIDAQWPAATTVTDIRIVEILTNSSNKLFIRVIKCRRMRCVGNIAGVGEIIGM